jgi:hypothetical protein
MRKSIFIKLALVAIISLLAIIAYKLFWSVAEPKVEYKVAQIGLTSNEVAAQGPLPGEVSLYTGELACAEAQHTPGYYSSLNGAEISDATRSGIFPCATFSGSFNSSNEVLAWRSADKFPGISYMNNRKPGELYIVGGEFPTLGDPNPAGPWVAKANATTGEQYWRTYLDNPNASGRWIGNANLNILENGKIVFAWSNQIVLIDPDSGQILAHNTLPSGEAPTEDVNYKHLTVAPDGTLILKDQTRPTGCKLQGTMAIIKCVDEGMKQPNSQLVAVNAETLEVIHDIVLPEPASPPFIITEFEGKIAIYIGFDSSGRRAFWDPQTQKLSMDETWTVFPMQEGQTTATAPTLVGDWVSFQLNGLFSEKKASSVVVVNQYDASRTNVIFPFGELEPGQFSFAPPKNGADPENSMIYSADMGVGKVAGIKLDQETGEMETAFVLDNMTTGFQPVIGPKDRRVLMLSRMKLNAPHEPLKLALFTENYTEQVTWRDALSGKILAESDYFEPMAVNGLLTPGFGGRIYYMTPVGQSFYSLQVLPKTTP